MARSASAANQRASHAAAVSRSMTSRADSIATVPRCASFSARCERSLRFSSRGNSCIKPIFDMVMKSRVSDQLSAPLVGTFSTPSFNFGSGSSPAGPAISRAASTMARCDSSCGELRTATCSASASDSGGPDAIASVMNSSTTIAAMTARAGRRRSAMATRGTTKGDGMEPPRTHRTDQHAERGRRQANVEIRSADGRTGGGAAARREVPRRVSSLFPMSARASRARAQAPATRPARPAAGPAAPTT